LLEWSDIVLRLGVATLASAVIGLNRDLHDKPIGLRTLGLVGLATALAVMLASPAAIEAGRLSDATSRVIQGILTGIGFLGAGVIVHAEQHKVKGLTSAACVWFTACIGVVCGLGHWRLVAVGLGIAFLLLVGGGPLERAIHRLFNGRNTNDVPPTP
jgi:putative Mg2+ transporter-C (MgtC) family protein